MIMVGAVNSQGGGGTYIIVTGRVFASTDPTPLVIEEQHTEKKARDKTETLHFTHLNLGSKGSKGFLRMDRETTMNLPIFHHFSINRGTIWESTYLPSLSS